ncbi:SusC/RagA family TonB-linked outer membrane protein [Pedobacter sp. HMF7056]|uniref:SusC/RagA family TonB-linked outer membrane protein n=2 Tax=Hufsiella ginkgonis TaxID=2695274 RepID=A0A7K1XZK0_9SPHI|nr:SusC/RagA family TonB-linked outer membrane protein [Hufsiella ginkgonis]
MTATGYLLALIIFSGGAASARQTPLVSGTVKDSRGVTLPGVTVQANNADGKMSGRTSTNADGVFSFAALPTGTYSFTFSFVGFENTVLTGFAVDGSARVTVDAVLKESTTTLNQVVVTGYGSSSKSRITGAVTSVSAEELNRGVLTSPAQLLQGKVPGLNITRSGDPNSKGATILRGPSTLREGAQEPFYVIDGVPGASIDLLAPDDIASIDVLKDASSTAIYGSRAANGVIMVTTKKAKPGQSRISYSAYAATEEVSNRIEMLTGNELRAYLTANGKNLNLSDNNPGANTDWQKQVSRTGFSQNHNLSFNGNTNNTSYAASINYMDNEGIIKTSSLDRLILRASIEQKALNDRLKITLTGTNSLSNLQTVASDVFPNMLKYLPTVNVRQADGSYTENFSRGSYLNPVSLIESNTFKGKVKTFLGHGMAEASLFTGLKYTLSLSLQDEQLSNDQYLNRYSGLAVGAGGRGIRNTYNNRKKVLETYFNYDKSFGDLHDIKLLAGYSWQEDRNGDGFQSSNQGFVSDELSYSNLGLGNFGMIPNGYGSIGISTQRVISFYGRADYQFDNKYTLQASLRRDGSSNFGINNQWGLFPAVSAGWRIGQESFMKDLTYLNELKLRAGYGVSGNSQGFDAFTRLLIYGSGPTAKFYYNGQYINAIGPSQNENPDLKWERTAMTNVGLDIAVFNNRLSASIDVYDKKTSDLIWVYPVSTTQYFVNTLTANAGEISNKGVEIGINATPFRTDKFRWSTSVNFAHNKNNVESLSNDKFTLTSIPTAYLGGKGQSGNTSQVVTEGMPIGSFNTWRYAGKDSKGVTQIYKKDGSLTTAPTSADFVATGSAQPKLIYGWNNSFSYRNLDLNFFVRGVYGNKVLNATLAALNAPLDATTLNIPRFTLGESVADNNAYLISDRFIESGSYLRLDNATLGYTINTKLKSISRLRVYTSANNLFTITDYRGIDPEINIGGLTPGIDNNNYYPKTRSYIFGLNVIF